MSDPQYLAQIGHFLGGALLVFGVGAFGGHGAAVVTLCIGSAIAAVKEFVFDLAPWGEGDSLKDSVEDFVFYEIGGLAGGGLFLIAVHVHAVFR